MLTSAVLCRVTGSSSSCVRGGMSVRASFAALWFFIMNSMAALRLKASTSAVSFSVCELPTLRTSSPSVLLPIDSSGCSLMPFSMISAMCFSEGPYCFCM